MKTIFGSALVTLAPSTTEYIRFNGETLFEWNGASDWSDYIYAGGKRIARADNYEDQLVTQGSSCSSCATYFRLRNGAGYMLSGYVIHSGDKLLVRQWQSSGVHGGVGLDFASGGNTLGVGDMASDTWINQWHYRSFDLSTVAGNTVTSAWVTTQSTPASGGWNINYQDFVLLSYDGTVHKLYSHDQSANLEISGTTGPTYSVTHVPNLGNVTGQTTTFYHGDHLGSSRLLSNANGYPTWQGTYYPYGMEYTPPGSTDNTATVNNYKFTGKERDAETGLDYFGARVYSSVAGRFMSVDPIGLKANRLLDPQQLNRFSYVRNNPMFFVDNDGRDLHIAVTNQVVGTSTVNKYTAAEMKANTHLRQQTEIVPTYRVVITNDSGHSFETQMSRDTIRNGSAAETRGNYGHNSEAPPGSYSGEIQNSHALGDHVTLSDRGSSSGGVAGPDGDRTGLAMHIGPGASEGCLLLTGGKSGRDGFIDQLDNVTTEDQQNALGDAIKVTLIDRNLQPTQSTLPDALPYVNPDK